MKKVIVICVVLVSIMLGTLVLAQGETKAVVPSKPDKLVVSWWGFNLDLLNKNIAEPFEQKYGIEVEWDVGDNVARLARLVVKKEKPVVDVAAFTPTFAYRAIQEGVLQPYRPERIPNLAYIYDWARDPLSGHYVVAYTVQGMGIYYRTDKIEPPVTSWKDFWRPGLSGYITWPEMNTTYGPALLLMSSKVWGESERDLDAGWQKLVDIIERAPTVYRRSSEAIMLLQQEEVWLAPMPSFAWGSVEALGLPLERVLPEEGVIGEMSVVGVVNGTPNAYWAEEFINFLLSHEVQMAEALDLVDSPVNTFVELPVDVAAQLVYGEELIDSLVFVDPTYIGENIDEWVEKWNELKL